MLADNPASKPATPRRTTPMQALSSLFRTPTRIRTPTTNGRRNKRSRGRTSSLSSSTPSAPNTPSLPAVVLQTYSVSTDSIVLTALPSVPFCCHEDLLTMSRSQLEAVVRALNARLPRRMQIGPEDDFWQTNNQDRAGQWDDDDDGLSRMSEAEMKRRIEELVGIRPVVGKNRVSRLGLGLGERIGVPPAPKAARTRDATWRPYERTPWDMKVDSDGDQTDDSSIMVEDALTGSSPLASRSKCGLRVRGRSNTLSRLAILQEENESKEDGSEDNETRPSKRQRVSLEGVAQDPDGGSQAVQEVRESKLIEHMDLSGSPLIGRDDDAFLDDLAKPNERAAATTISPDCASNTSEKGVETIPQRRRSARIKEIAMKGTSLVDKGNKATSNAMSLKSSFLRSKALSPGRSTKGNSTSLGECDTGKDSGTPREVTIRLPFTSTPPHQKSDAPAWSAPRILRSHSQRLLNSTQLTGKQTSLGRSQSERYPRASDLAFVTINRPRYRFTRRKSKESKITKENHSCSSSLTHGAERSDGKDEEEKENEAPKFTTRNSGMGSLHTLPSALCGFLAPRSRAPSTSTVASNQGDGGDSSARPMVGEAIAPTVMESVVGTGTTERVWEALGRMAVDSL